MIPELTSEQVSERRERLPLRPYPLLYFAFGHFCLFGAGITMGIDPRGIAGFFYHPRMLAVVHLVTLGWISSSILGALYLVLPMGFRVTLSKRRLDGWILVLHLAGVMGLVAHFFLDEPHGMLWSAGVLVLSFCLASLRFLPAVGRSKASPAVKLHFYFAFANILLAAFLAIAVGWNKFFPFLPRGSLSGVLAHAHLAMLGWATLTVMGAGYRLIPMVLPAAIPSGRSIWGSALLTELGVLTLAASLLFDPSGIPFAAAICAGGVATFGYQLVWMRRNPRPAPAARRSPELGTIQTLQAFIYLAIAVLLGLALAIGAPAIWKVQGAMAYGVLFLLGFLAQIVAGISSRLVPWAAYLWAFGDTGFRRTPPSPHEVPPRPVQWMLAAAWGFAVPCLALGLSFDWIPMVSAGGWLLAAGAFSGALFLSFILVRSRTVIGTEPRR